jgi:DNA-directed RNA polymerase specialized sigma subunit
MKYTIEEIKKELSSYIQDKKYIEEKKADIEELREQATNTTSMLTDMPKGSNPINDKIAEYVAKILDLQAENLEFILNLEKRKKEIENIINTMEQPYKNILYFRYIKGYNLTEVASLIGNEYKWCCVLHGKALEQYRKIKERRIKYGKVC